MNKNLFVSAFCLILFFLSCAYRDNQFDPQSPLYRVFPPELSVTLQFDSTKVSSISNDTFYAYTPLNLTISASAKGRSKRDTDLEILYLHYLNGKEKDKDLIEDSINITLQDSGIHLLQFQSSEKSGTETAIEQKIFILSNKEGPRIVSFISSKDTLTVGQDHDIQFTTEVIDSNNLLKGLVYVISPSDIVIKTIGEHSSKVLDTLSYRFFRNDTGKLIITLKAVDILERVHSIDIELNFIENTPPHFPPEIKGITYSPRNIVVMQEVDFMVNFTASSNKTTQYWSYGDQIPSVWTTESSHQFLNPGEYKVSVKVEDDSGYFDTTSILVHVYPIANKPPHIDSLLITPDSGDAPLKVHFFVYASDSDGKFLHYKWIMGTGHEFFAASEFVFTYWYPSKYPVTVIAYDDKWGTDTIWDTVIVTGNNLNKPCLTAYPVPAFTFQEIYFQLENAPEEYKEALYYWDFPRRGPELGTDRKVFSFQLDGEYEVKLSVFLKDTIHTYTVPVKIIMPKF
jgi:hypothetical protein